KRAYCLKTQPATGETYPKSDLFNKAPDKIKVDAELVRDIHISGTKQAIVASVVRCCEDLGITVVAEGVETLEEWCWLQSVGIRLFQGFLFSRPCLNGIGEICWPVARQAMDL
ncbi:EAL domain-containing protein, partial [Klebsiella pneumoniae]